MNKLRVAVVMGGPSAEHEVSLDSGEAAVANLSSVKYEITKVIISKSGLWQFNEDEQITLGNALERLAKDIDVVVLALHGSFGEDGTLQALLEQRNVAFTGSSAASSLLAMDKYVASQLYEAAGLLSPITRVYPADESVIAEEELSDWPLPLIVKPVRQGSSVGISIVREREKLQAAVQLALQYDQQVMIQEYINGREVSCGVIEKEGELIALPPTELIPVGHEFFNYDAKYTTGGAQEITPPDMPEGMIKQIQGISIRAHNILGCSGYSRTDMILNESGIYLIETNTLPGMTSTSIMPQQAAAAGISFAEFLDLIIAAA